MARYSRARALLLDDIYPNAAARWRPLDVSLGHDPDTECPNHFAVNASEDATDISLLSESSNKTRNTFTKGRAFFTSLTRRLPQGWRFGVTIGAILSTLALVINATMAGIAYSRMSRNGSTSIAPIFTGACTTVSRYSIIVHLAINVLSSLLLGASSYCMQCLCAPTRENIDKAHQKGRWLDIGVQSLTNLRFISRKKLRFWVALALSSIPLHFVYNSTFFTSTTSNYYDVYIASPAFMNGSPFPSAFFDDSELMIKRNESITSGPLPLSIVSQPVSVQETAMQGVAGPFEQLSPRACIEAYANPILRQRRNLIIITDMIWDCENPDAEAVADHWNSTYDFRVCVDSSLYRAFSVAYSPIMEDGDWFTWMCDEIKYGIKYGYQNDNCANHYKEKLANISAWTVGGYPVKECFSEVLENKCSLHVAVNLLLVVIGFNAVKVIVLFLVVATVRDEPLITVGDAVASFLKHRDETTQDICLFTKHMLENEAQNLYRDSRPKAYEAASLRRWKAATSRRWVTFAILMSTAIAIVLRLLHFGMSELDSRFKRGSAEAIGELGLGKLSPYSLITGWSVPSNGDSAVIAVVLIVNLPQALLSFLYLLLNGVFTCMALAAEWNRYGFRRRALRVSRPSGKQRCTYFLQVPYRMGVPLMVGSMLLHWLVSQSFFVAKITVKDQIGMEVIDDFTGTTTAAYSPLGMILTVVVAACVSMTAGMLGLWKLKPGIPMASSSSMAISAACHAPNGTSEHAALMWGVIPQTRGEGRLPHCAFSDRKVEEPVVGQCYA